MFLYLNGNYKRRSNLFESVNVLSLYSAGLLNILQPDILLVLIAGTAIGMVFGVIPGLSATIGVAIFTPLTFAMDTYMAFALLLGVYCGSIYGGSISAILINIPGTPAAVMTRIDGHPMAVNGEAERAIGLATTSSFIGGIISVFFLAFFAPLIAKFALQFSAHEYFAVCIFGISVIAYISTGSMLKGFISGFLGLLLSTIGMDPVEGYSRFSYGNIELLGGLEMIPIMVGVFGIAEVLKMIEGRKEKVNILSKINRTLPSFNMIKKMFGTVIRGSIIGVFIGAVPATGGTIASIISYGVEKRLAKNPENFGKGEPRGIVGPESANNAATGGAMIPMMTLGIPGDVVTAILIGALMLHGLSPGPMLFKNHMDLVSAIFILMFLSNFIFLCFGLFGAKYFAKVITLPRAFLVSMILCLAIVGTYSVRNSIFDIWILIFSGIGGYLMNKIRIPVPPLILGFILGKLIEINFRQALILSYGNVWDFFNRPLSCFFLIMTIFVIVSPYFSFVIKKIKKIH